MVVVYLSAPASILDSVNSEGDRAASATIEVSLNVVAADSLSYDAYALEDGAYRVAFEHWGSGDVEHAALEQRSFLIVEDPCVRPDPNDLAMAASLVAGQIIFTAATTFYVMDWPRDGHIHEAIAFIKQAHFGVGAALAWK